VKTGRQEPDVVSSRAVLAVLAGTLAATAVGVAVAWLLARDGPAGGASEPGHPSEVSAMETTPFAIRAQGLEDRARASGWLASYGWIDRRAGLVHIPIERAIDLYIQRRAARGGEP
jgi:hypothetical protein